MFLAKKPQALLFLTMVGFAFEAVQYSRSNLGHFPSPGHDSQSCDVRRRMELQHNSFRDVGLGFLAEPGAKIFIFPRPGKATSG